MITVKVGLSGEGRGDRERDVNVDVINMIIRVADVFVHNSHIELK